MRHGPAPSEPSKVVADRRPVVKLSGVEIRAVWPADRVDLWVEADLREELGVGERAIDLAEEHWREVDRLAGAVRKPQTQREVVNLLNLCHALDRVSHICHLSGALLD